MVNLGKQPIADASREPEKKKEPGLVSLLAGLLDLFFIVPVLGFLLFVRPVMCLHRLVQTRRFGVAAVLVVPFVVFAVFAVRDLRAKRLSKQCAISFAIALVALIGLSVAVPDIGVWPWN